MGAIQQKLSQFHRIARGGALAAIAVGFVLGSAAPGWSADGIVLGGKARPKGPTAAELADRAQAEREALEKRAKELAAQEEKLREKAAAEAAAARTRCPELIQQKYPWISCETNEVGRKELVVPGSGSALGVEPMMTFRKG